MEITDFEPVGAELCDHSSYPKGNGLLYRVVSRKSPVIEEEGALVKM